MKTSTYPLFAAIALVLQSLSPKHIQQTTSSNSPTPVIAASYFKTGANKACESEKFDGSDRKAAKISVAKAKVENFNTLTDFIQTLPADDDMGKNHVPPIGTGPTSARVKEEQRNVHIKNA